MHIRKFTKFGEAGVPIFH